MAKSERPTHRCEGCGVYLFREELDLGGGHPQARGDGRYDSCGPVSLVAPQQEPEGDGWEITDEDRRVLVTATPTMQGWHARLMRGAEIIRDRLRARVQPRTVSEEEVEEVFRLTAMDADSPQPVLTRSAFRRALRFLDITITPTEEQDQRAGERS